MGDQAQAFQIREPLLPSSSAPISLSICRLEMPRWARWPRYRPSAMTGRAARMAVSMPFCSSRPVARKANDAQTALKCEQAGERGAQFGLVVQAVGQINDVGRSAGTEQGADRAAGQSCRYGPPLRDGSFAMEVEQVAHAEDHHENSQADQQRLLGQVDQQRHAQDHADQR